LAFFLRTITTLATSQNFQKKKKKKSDFKYSAFVQGGLQLHYNKKYWPGFYATGEKRTQEGL
jgi:hypothetical protein